MKHVVLLHPASPLRYQIGELSLLVMRPKQTDAKGEGGLL